jgi:hypothetical protein
MPRAIPIPQLVKVFSPWYDWPIRERFRIKQRSEDDERPLFERLLELAHRPRPDLGSVIHYAKSLRESLRPARGADIRTERMFRASVWLKVLWNELGLTAGKIPGPYAGVPEVRSALEDLSEIVLELGQLWRIKDAGESAAGVSTLPGRRRGLKRPGEQLIRDLGDVLTRLRLAVEQMRKHQDAPPVPAPKGRQKQRDPKMEARDKWIYRECYDGTPLGEIRRKLRDKAGAKGWAVVTTNRIWQIGREYAIDNGLELPPPRQNK